MLYTKLKNLYNENEVLAEEYPLDEYFILLQTFISSEVSLGAEYLSPYRFSLKYSKHPKEAIRFFLGLTDSEDVLEQYYKYECDQCTSINIIKDEASLVNFRCRECGFEDHLTTADNLSEVKLLFKLNDDLLEEFIENLKQNPLSNLLKTSSAVLEGGLADIDVTFKSAEELIYKNGKPIGKRPVEREKKFKYYRDML